MDILGIIPARGGSKGIPGKNLAALGGKPLLAWTLDAALRSRAVDRLVVSTDDDAIAAEADRRGVPVPVRRPPRLALDTTPTMEVVLHVLRWLAANGQPPPRGVMLLQPTSPFRTAGDIDAAARLWRESGADAVISVGPVRDHPRLVREVDRQGRLHPSAAPGAQARRQDVAPAYKLNGAIYLTSPDRLLATRSWQQPYTQAYCMPESRSLDIDTEWDLFIARSLAETLHHELDPHRVPADRPGPALLHHC